MDYRSINVKAKGYDFKSGMTRTYIADYPTCKEVILRGCYVYNKGEDPEINLRVNKVTFGKVCDAWRKYNFPALNLFEDEVNQEEFSIGVSFDGIFKSAAWLDIFITFLRIYDKFNTLDEGITHLVGLSDKYYGLKDVLNFAIQYPNLIGQIDNAEITSEDHEENGLIVNREKFLNNEV